MLDWTVIRRNTIKHTEREKKPILPDVSFGAKSEIYKPCIQSRRQHYVWTTNIPMDVSSCVHGRYGMTKLSSDATNLGARQLYVWNVRQHSSVTSTEYRSMLLI